MNSGDLPALDCHAHVAPDVTGAQTKALGGAFVFAMTRSLDEAEAVADRQDSSLVWGCGIHPGLLGADDAAYDGLRFASLAGRFAVIGEVGLDRRAGNLDRQVAVLRSVLRTAASQPVMVSLHSAGRVEETLALLEEHGRSGAILHWFLGDEKAMRRADRLGCYFSVNAAMPDEILQNVPKERMLPETDYPATRRRGGGSRPGDLANLEAKVAVLTRMTESEVRRMWFRNLRRLCTDCGALDRLPPKLVDCLLEA
jgi:TatD DNase family protein